MARSHLQDVRSIPDPLLSYNFDLIIYPKSLSGNSDAGRALTVRCKSTSLPGSQIEPVVTALHGTEVKHAGRRMWTKTLECTLIECRDMATSNSLNDWMNLIRNPILNTGTYKSIYSSNAEILLYDDIPTVIKTYTLYGAWPETIGEGSLDGSQSTGVEIPLTLSYDYYDTK